MNKLTLSQKILAGFLACTVILIAVTVFSFRNSEKFVDTNQWVNHTHEVLNEFDKVLMATVDLETGSRGYVISGDEVFLQPYIASRNSIWTHVAKVKSMTLDNPLQQKNIQDLEAKCEMIADYHDNLIATRRSDFQKAREIVSSRKGLRIQDEIRRIIANCKGIESNLLAERKKLSEEDARNFNIIFIVLLFVIAIVLISVYFIINTNLKALKKAETENANKNWLLSGSNELNETARGERQADELAQAIISKVCSFLDAQLGIIYLYDETLLYPAGSYAFDLKTSGIKDLKIGEGLVGQAARDHKTILFKDVPEDYILIKSGLSYGRPKNLVVLPLVQDGYLRGVIEIGTARELSPLDLEFLDIITENIAIVISAAQSRTRLKELLEETQRQAEELESQQEELRQSNEELLEKTRLLEKSEAQLKTQQEELQQTNEELEEKANLLEEQKEKLESAKVDIETKARELEITSKYKSEFLANMSHELRTPLNSILILAQMLSENKNKTLTEKEVDFSKNIFNSGEDLLNLINEILDLSKVESGKMELDIAETSFTEIQSELSAMFTEVAKNKNINFKIRIEDKTPGATIVTDKQRLEQVLRNLLSNAFKFTGKSGTVSLTMGKAENTANLKNQKLARKESVIFFKVSDTGIGIPEDKLGIIFEAFQQVDGSTKRKYGGTGLGLSISRELANALGGEIQLQSKEGEGSSFTLFLPQSYDPEVMNPGEKTVEVKEKKIIAPAATVSPSKQEKDIADDRYNAKQTDKIILIMEDDPVFGEHLLSFVRERGYKGILAIQGTTGLSLARHYKPDAIILDMKLPVMNGTEVLKHLKADPGLRHIPVQIISGYDKRKEGMELGAFDFIRKPISRDDLHNAFGRIEEFVSRKLKRLLIIEDDPTQNNAIKELIGNGDVKCFSAYSGEEALEMMHKEHYDCAIVDLGLPDMTGIELLEKIKADASLSRTPVVVYTGKDLSREENNRLSQLASAVVLKTANSHERLLDETILFLHRVESRLPKEKQSIIRKLHKTDEVLRNKKVLVVDDDIRNIYSLTNVLTEEGLQCLTAENGRVAVEMLKANPGIDIVLMDVMMPEMDGYEATRAIRSLEEFSKMPIIALTAKAMKGDREKCLEAGMSDYISKPVNIEQLLSLMRVWLYV